MGQLMIVGLSGERVLRCWSTGLAEVLKLVSRADDRLIDPSQPGQERSRNIIRSQRVQDRKAPRKKAPWAR